MSLPGKGQEGHICPTFLMLWWCHLECHKPGGSKKIITLWSGGHEVLTYGE